MELERRKQDYADRMEADALRFTELQNQKEEDNKKYNEKLNKLFQHHQNIIEDL